ncbi:MAG: acyltransferase, partial [Anaerolineae bacterium]
GEGCRVFVKDGGVLRFTGSAVVAGNSRFFAHHLIEIGDDALISWDVTLRDADGHTILQGGAAIVRAEQTVRLGRHVWIGQGVDILPGSEIGEGAMVGARSLVKGEVPPHALVAGVPQRILRSDIEWRA